MQISEILKGLEEIINTFEDLPKDCYNEDENSNNLIDFNALLSQYTEEFPVPGKFKRYFTSEINTNLSNEEKKKKIVIKYISNWRTVFMNNGFNNYRFLDVEEIK